MPRNHPPKSIPASALKSVQGSTLVPAVPQEATHELWDGPLTARTHRTEPWAPRPEGPRSLENAIILARGHLAQANEPGLRGVPDYVHFVLSENVPEDAYACYLQIGELCPDERIAWDDCVHDVTKMIPVRIRPSVLESDEAIVAVIAHELYEVVRLRAIFKDLGGR